MKIVVSYGPEFRKYCVNEPKTVDVSVVLVAPAASGPCMPDGPVLHHIFLYILQALLQPDANSEQFAGHIAVHEYHQHPRIHLHDLLADRQF